MDVVHVAVLNLHEHLLPLVLCVINNILAEVLVAVGHFDEILNWDGEETAAIDGGAYQVEVPPLVGEAKHRLSDPNYLILTKSCDLIIFH